jgi:hypothetical protein
MCISATLFGSIRHLEPKVQNILPDDNDDIINSNL